MSQMYEFNFKHPNIFIQKLQFSMKILTKTDILQQIITKSQQCYKTQLHNIHSITHCNTAC